MSITQLLASAISSPVDSLEGIRAPIVAQENDPDFINWIKGGNLGVSIISSEAATIMGENPYKKRSKLFAERLVAKHNSEEFPVYIGGNAKYYEQVKAWAEASLQKTYSKACIEGRIYPHLRSVFDGIEANGNSILKLKYPDPKAESRAEFWQRFMGQKILCNKDQLKMIGFSHYYAELQMEMYISNAQEAYLILFNTDVNNGALVKVMADSEYQNNMVVQLSLFALDIVKEEAPSVNKEQDVLAIQNQAFNPLENKWLALTAKIEPLITQLTVLKEERAEIETKMSSFMDGFKYAQFGAVRLKHQVNKKGSISYKDVVKSKLSDFDLDSDEADQFRGKPLESFTVEKVA